MSATEENRVSPFEDDKHQGSTTGSSLEAGTPVQEKTEHEFPEGGARAWMVVVGAALSLFATFGYANAFG